MNFHVCYALDNHAEAHRSQADYVAGVLRAAGYHATPQPVVDAPYCIAVLPADPTEHVDDRVAFAVAGLTADAFRAWQHLEGNARFAP